MNLRRSLAVLAVPAMLSLPAPEVTAQDAPRLHTIGAGASKGNVLALTGGTPTRTELSPVPTSQFTGLWQLPMKGDLAYVLSTQGQKLQFVSFQGTAARVGTATEAQYASGVQGVLTSAGSIFSGTAGILSAATCNTVRIGEYRYVQVYASGPTDGRVLTVLELEGTAVGDVLRASSAVAEPGYAAAADAKNILGIGYNPDPLSDNRGRLVAGGGTATYVLTYDAGAASGRMALASPKSFPNPAGFQFVSAGPADGAGKFWVVGIASGQAQVRAFDAQTGYAGSAAYSAAIASADRVVPAFDAYDRNRLALVVYQAGKTTVHVVSNASTGQATVRETGKDFSSVLQAPPVAIVPGADGYLVGREAGGGSVDKLQSFPTTGGSAGAIGDTGITFGAERHQTLLVEAPDVPQLSIAAESPGATTPGDVARFTVTRSRVTAGVFAVTYVVESVDGNAAAGVDWQAPSGTLSLPSGATTGTIEIRTLAVAGCKDTRTIRVRLTNTNATLGTGSATKPIAASTACDLNIAAPGAPAAPGQSLTFTVTRNGDTSGPYPVSFTTEPGANTVASDYTPPSSPVTIAKGATTAQIVVQTTPSAETCRPAKGFTVTVTSPSAGGQKTAAGQIAAVTATCAAQVVVTSPKQPYLPMDEITLTLDAGPSGTLNGAGTTWEVVQSDADWAYRWVGASTGQTARLQFTRVPERGGTRTVRYRVPYAAGTPAPQEGTVELRIADYRELVRLDGPPQVVRTLSGQRRFKAKWLGGADRAGDWYSAPRRLLWKTENSSGQISTVSGCSNGTTCTHTLPAGVRRVFLEATPDTGSPSILVEELEVTEVAAPSGTGTSTVRYVPVGLAAQGSGGSDFETEMTLVNRGTTTALVEIDYKGRTLTEYVGGGRQFVVNGIVDRAQEADPSVDGSAAPVKVTFKNLTSANDVEVLARTTTPTGRDDVVRSRGRAGLAYLGLRSEELFGDPNGNPRRPGKAVLLGLRGTSTVPTASVDRTNLAIVNPEPGTPVQVQVKFFPPDGGEPFVQTKTLPENGNPFFQYGNLALYLGGREVAYATVEWVSGGAFTTYATPVDNVSNDGSFIFPATGDDGSQSSALVLPVVLEIPNTGIPGKFNFLSDLSLTTPLGSQATKVDYSWAGTNNGTSGLVTLNRTVSGQTILGRKAAPDQTATGVVKVFRDEGSGTKPGAAGTVVVLGLATVSKQGGGTFGLNQIFSGTKVDGPSTGDPDGTQYGRYGIYLPALPIERLRNVAELAILGLRNDGDPAVAPTGVRSNLALYNPGDQPIGLKLDLFGSDRPNERRAIEYGACGVSDGQLTLAARTFCQINQVLQTAGEPIRSGYVAITRTGTDANLAFGAYGVINDNQTNDGAYLAPYIKGCDSLNITISPSSLPQGNRGVAYGPVTFTATPSGRTYTWSATGLPANLSLTPGGVLSGTPSAFGTSTVTVTVRDQAGCSKAQTYALVVSDCPPITILPETLAQPKEGELFRESLTASGTTSAVGWSFVSGEPSWLSLNAQTGELRGTPGTGEAGKTYAVKVRVTDSRGCSGERTYQIVVGCPNVASPRILASPARLCGSGTVTLSIDGPITGATYTWTGSGLTQSATGTSITVTLGAPGTTYGWSVSATINDCHASGQLTGYVVDTPVLAPTIGLQGAEVCEEGQTGSLDASLGTNESGTWTSDVGGSFDNPTSQTARWTAPPAFVGGAALTWTVSSTVSGTVCPSRSATTTVTVRRKPVAPQACRIKTRNQQDPPTVADCFPRNGLSRTPTLNGNAPDSGASGTWRAYYTNSPTTQVGTDANFGVVIDSNTDWLPPADADLLREITLEWTVSWPGVASCSSTYRVTLQLGNETTVSTCDTLPYGFLDCPTP